MPVVPFTPQPSVPAPAPPPDPVYLAMAAAMTKAAADRVIGRADDSDVLSQSKSSTFEKSWKDLPMSKNIEDERDDVILEHNKIMPSMKATPNGK